MSINSVFASGNLVKDCEVKGKDNGVCSFTIAVNDRRKVGEDWQDVPNYIDCVVFGKRASALAPMLKKGLKVSIAGKLRQDRWEKDGQKFSKLGVVVDELEFMTTKGEKKDEEPTPW